MTIDFALKFLWPAIWQSAMLAVIVGGVTLLLRERLEPRWRYLLWGIVLLRLALPVLPSSPVGLLPTQHQPQTAAVVDAPSPNIAMPHVANHATPKPPPPDFATVSVNETITKPTITPTSTTAAVPDTSIANVSLRERVTWGIFAAWLCGALFFAFKYASGEIWLQRLCRRVRPTNDMLLNTMLHECRRELRIRRRVRLYVVPQEIAAASFGVIFPTIILSERVVRQFSPDALRLVLLHELAHIKRLDPAVHVFVRLVSIFHWPNPVLWLTRWRLECEREHACDAAVLHKLERKKHREYGQMVLTFADWCAAKRHASALVGVFPNHDLKRRITMIIKHKPSRWWQPLLGATLITTLALVGLTTAKPAMEENQKSGTPATPDVPIIQVIAEKTLDIPEGNVLIRGNVVDADDKPVADAKVYYDYDPLSGFTQWHCMSNNEGKFAFLILERNLNLLKLFGVSPDGTQMGLPNVFEIPVENRIGEVKLKLSEARVITGNVTDADGKPIEGALVGAPQSWWALSVKTDVSGNFRFPLSAEMPIGLLYAVKSGVGFQAVYTGERHDENGRFSSEGKFNGPFHLVLDGCQAVSVKVTDENDVPIPGCRVTPSLFAGQLEKPNHFDKMFIAPESAPSPIVLSTNEQGIATFDWIPEKELQYLVFYARGPETPVNLPDGTSQCYGQASTKSSLNIAWPNNIDDFEPGKILVIKLPRCATLKGTIRYEDGTPAYRANVSITMETAQVQNCSTRRNGEFEISGNVDEHWRIQIVSQSPDYVSSIAETVDSGDGREIQYRDFVIPRGVKLHGYLYGDDGGKIAKGVVTINMPEVTTEYKKGVMSSYRSSLTTYSSPSDPGYYEKRLLPGDYELVATDESKANQETKKITIAEGQSEMQVDLHLKPMSKEE